MFLKSSKQVLHLISSKGFFGAENVVLELAKGLSHTDFQPIIVVFENSQSPHTEIAEKAVKNHLRTEIFHCRGRLDLKTIHLINRFIKNNDINVLHSHGFKSNFYGLISSVITHIPIIVTCHNWLGTSAKMRFYKWLDKLLLNRFNEVVVVSDILKKEILKSGILEKKVKVIYNGIDVANYKWQMINGNKVRKEFGIKDDEKVVGTVGRLTPEKGHIYLLKAAKRVIDEFPNVKVLIVGDGPLMENLKLEVGNLKLGDRVIFTGIRNDIPNLLKIMDIFVMPSLKEGMPMALLEAMVAKKPVIAAKVGAIPKIIEDGYTGLLVDSGDERELSNLIIELLRNEEKADFLARNSYEKVKGEFSSKKMIEKYLAVYNNLYQLANNKRKKKKKAQRHQGTEAQS